MIEQLQLKLAQMEKAKAKVNQSIFSHFEKYTLGCC